MLTHYKRASINLVRPGKFILPTNYCADSSRQKAVLGVQFIGSVALRIVCYISVVYFLYTHANQHALAYDLLIPEIERIPFAATVLSFPSAPEGTVSVAIWALICNVAAKEALNAFIA